MSFLKILVFGDAYRYQFLRDLLEEGVYTNEFIHTENLKQHHCVVTREKVLDSSRQDEYLFFESNRIPAFTQIIFPKEKAGPFSAEDSQRSARRFLLPDG